MKSSLVDPEGLIAQVCKGNNKLHELLLTHSRHVAKKALQIAQRASRLYPDEEFIYQAAMLHDVGIVGVNAPSIHCSGPKPYICHGIIGREILEKNGLHRHAIVCERHIGTGISKDDIIKNRLPLPQRDMIPQNTEEIIVCMADKFFSKSHPEQEKNYDQIIDSLAKHGKACAARFKFWSKMLDLKF